MKKEVLDAKTRYILEDYSSSIEKELKSKYIIVKNGSFNITKKQKMALEEVLEHKLKKISFSIKNLFMFNYAKTELEKLGYSFRTEEELEEELEQKKEQKKKELLEELEEEKKN